MIYLILLILLVLFIGIFERKIRWRLLVFLILLGAYLIFKFAPIMVDIVYSTYG
jgi:hypothetical protein